MKRSIVRVLSLLLAVITAVSLLVNLGTVHAECGPLWLPSVLLAPHGFPGKGNINIMKK